MILESAVILLNCKEVIRKDVSMLSAIQLAELAIVYIGVHTMRGVPSQQFTLLYQFHLTGATYTWYKKLYTWSL